MAWTIRRPGAEAAATAEDLRTMAELAEPLQADPRFHIMYLGTTAESIMADVSELADWSRTAVIAEEHGRMVGWLVADVDADMGRVWWFGPMVTEVDRWDGIADELYAAAKALLPPEVDEEEAAADDRGLPVQRWCERHGFEPNTASVLLRLEPERLSGPPDPPIPSGGDAEHPEVRPLASGDHLVVKALHDEAFPGTHTTPEALVASEHPRLVLEVGPGRVVGYAAYEMQSDGSGYVDFLAVDQSRRGSGFGGRLVAEACRRMITEGAVFVHLTVREDNAAARALYARLGFIEERVVRPYRIGFDLG